MQFMQENSAALHAKKFILKNPLEKMIKFMGKCPNLDGK